VIPFHVCNNRAKIIKRNRNRRVEGGGAGRFVSYREQAVSEGRGKEPKRD
jgi:hypothetical protein